MGRKTRSGAYYSPYEIEPLDLQISGEIVAPVHFSLPDRLKSALEDASDAESDHEVSPPSESPAPGPLQPPVCPSSGPSCTPDESDGPKFLGKNWKATLKYREKRRLKRQNAASLIEAGIPVKGVALKKRKMAAELALECKTDAIHLGSSNTSTAWTARMDLEKDKREYSLDDVLNNYGMKYFDWNGIDSHPLVDNERRVFGILAGMPKACNWDSVQESAAAGIENAHPRLQVPPKCMDHRRGLYSALSVGISFGGGQLEPGYFYNSDTNAPVLKELAELPAFCRISGFTNSIFAAYAPRLHSYYADTLVKLYDHHKDLKPLYPKSVFSGSTFNFGPRTVSYPHRDWANLSWGWCAVTALGSFNPDMGGHFIIWDLGVVIRFPPGSTILMPSALLRHSNTAILQGETRYSFTQYTAGGIFRWVENGFKKSAQWKAEAIHDLEKIKAREEDDSNRWARGLDMYCKTSEY